MSGPRWLATRVLLIALSLAGAATAVGAQQRPDTTTKTPEQLVRERLRKLRPVAAPDTQRAADTTRAQPQGLRVETRGESSPPGGIERDSVMELLSRIQGYTATEYKGQEATFQADSGRLKLRTNAQVAREGQTLSADTLIEYDENTGIVCGFGRPTISGQSVESPLASERVCYDIEAQLGVAKNAETSISQGANWKLRADVYTRADSMYAHDAIFTDCDLPYPHQHYAFEANRVKVVQNNVLIARDVTLKFADVPVFWLPFMVQSLSRGRRSGILMPRFGINDIARQSSNYSRRIEDVGVFLAISDYMGAEVAMDWMSENYTALRGSLDYTNQKRFLNGGLTFRRFWKNEGGTELTLSANNNWQPNEFTRLGATANYSTSSAFVRRRTLDPRELTRSIDSNVSLNRQFGWGSMSLGGTRRQFLTDGNVWLSPSFGLNLNSVTLFEAEPGEAKWYNNASWSGTLSANMDQVKLGADDRTLTSQDKRDARTSLSSQFTLGKFGISQRFDFSENRLYARRDSVEQGDSLVAVSLPDSMEQRASWGLSTSYQINLIGTTTSLSPSLSLGGDLVKNRRSGDRMLAAPTRLDFGASLQSAVFGFWPGVGPIQRIRHRLSPSLNYTYSPKPNADSLQRAVFGSLGSVKERNQVTIGVNQTFEGKRKQREGGAAPEPVNAMGADSAANDTTSGPRRLPAGEAPIILLSLSTDAVLYDFVAAREEERGVQTQSISNSIQSDLLRNMQLRFTHDLFQEAEAPVGDPTAKPAREFKPHLASVSASLRVDSDSWLFRALRLGRGKDMPEQKGEAGGVDSDTVQAGTTMDRTKAELGMVGTRRRDPIGVQGGPVGSWNASFDYTMDRPREAERLRGARENQMVTANAQFQPTENWTMNWRTGYNFTISQFTDHILTLTRKLHDWDANFDFIRAQNGNFSFSFRVHLRANPDIKLDYEQQDLRGLPSGFGTGR